MLRSTEIRHGCISWIPQNSLESCPIEYNPDPDSLATLNLGSGTTGKTPKIVQITHRNWIESLFGFIINADVKSGKKKPVFLCGPAPIFFLRSLPDIPAGFRLFRSNLLLYIARELTPYRFFTQ
ncbi:MAG: AMP-binding protein [Kiritimatiellae bacterium]|nr:AMP-binding protein [Kiritimatiellia bacterium]